ncbi:flagellar hook protein FlgE [Pseudoduganella sp. RAF19]|uniref:flagellar hook protein FlgE n=1 Tax=Pseudoduganella sp. RAF19 TaxID=3233052 RepID=UPI003F987EAA
MSFDIALSGIQAINQQLDSISNNIANAGTYGFKSSRANFASMYAGSQPSGTQIGSVTQNIGLNGGVLNTGRGMDAAINGRGFFITKDSSGLQSYTRVGVFNKDATDYIVDSSGRRVQGYSLTPPSTTPGPMGDIKVPTGMLAAQPTTAVQFVANMSPDWTAPSSPWVAPNPGAATPVAVDPNSYNWSKTSQAYDSLGRSHTVTQYFSLDPSPASPATNGVIVHAVVDGYDSSLVGTGSSFGGAGNSSVALGFDNAGQLVTVGGTPVATTTKATLTFPNTGANASTIAIDYLGTTLQKGEVTTSTNHNDGYASGSFVGVELGTDGSVIAKYSNNEKQAIGILALATFPNEEGLTPVDNTSWTANNESGTPNTSVPGAGVAGTLSTSTLEGSNVDITSELVGLMTSQRNYQANSKVITTENQMMQSLMQAL